MNSKLNLDYYEEEKSQNSSDIELGDLIKNSKDNLIQNFGFDDEEKSTELYCISYLNMIGISILISSIFLYLYHLIYEKNKYNNFQLSINIIICIFLSITLFRNISIKNLTVAQDVKIIIFYHYSYFYIISIFIYVIYFLFLYFIPENYYCKNIGMIILSFLALIFLSYSYFFFKKREENYIFHKFFNYCSLSLSLSALYCFSFIIFINSYMIIFNNYIFIFMLTIISIILLTYYNDIIFCILTLLYQISFIEKIQLYNNSFKICYKGIIIFTSICIFFSIVSSNKLLYINKKNENDEIEKFKNDEEEEDGFTNYSGSSYETF